MYKQQLHHNVVQKTHKILHHPYYSYDTQNFLQIYTIQNDLTPRTTDKNKSKRTERDAVNAAASVQTGKGYDGVLFIPPRPRK